MKNVENPLIKNNFWNRLNYFICRKTDHIRYGSYYGMSQSTCKRCGKKLNGAIDSVPDWSKPW